MHIDMLSLFNQLTSDEKLADYPLSTTILSDHYFKFRYFYYIFKHIDTDMIEKVKPKIINKYQFSLTIIPSNKKYLNDIKETMKKIKKTLKTNSLLTMDINSCKSHITCNIRLNSINNEGELYNADTIIRYS